MKFTVFTPSYNRAYTLGALYDSLCAQSFKDFEWIIVDDGSTDNTGELVKGWTDSPFPLRYFYKENGGKPRAINFGVKEAAGDWFFMVDSDDRLLPNALEKLRAACDQVAPLEDFIGVSFAKGYPDGKYIKGVPPKVGKDGYVDATNLERASYNLDADMCEAYKTELFRRFPMAEWPGESFAPEQIAMNDMALAGYKLRWRADIIYVCDYLEDGLTQGGDKLEARNPMGFAMMYNHMLLYPTLGAKAKFKAAAGHIALSIVGKHPGYIFKSHRLRYTLPMLPYGVALSFRRRKQFKKRLGK